MPLPRCITIEEEYADVRYGKMYIELLIRSAKPCYLPRCHAPWGGRQWLLWHCTVFDIAALVFSKNILVGSKNIAQVGA